MSRALLPLAVCALTSLGMGFGLPPSEIRVGALQRPNGTSPKLWDHVPSRTAISWTHDTAFEYAYLQSAPKIVPLIAAEPLRWDAKMTKAILKIRSGVGQKSGRSLKTSDFIEAWTALKNLPADAPARKIFADNIQSLRAVDDLTLEIGLQKPDADLEAKLTLGFTSPEFETGAWTLDTWFPSRSATFNGTRGYSNSFFPTEGSEEFKRLGLVPSPSEPHGLALPRTDRLEQVWVESHATGLRDFLSAKLDILPLSPETTRAVLVSRKSGTLKPEVSEKGIRLEQGLAPEWTLALLNLRTLKDRSARSRIVAALDEEFWMNALDTEASLLGSTTLPALSDWGVPQSKIRPSKGSPSKIRGIRETQARASTLHADWSVLEPTTVVPSDALKTLAEHLEKAGFAANIETLPLKAALERFATGKSDLLILGWRWNYPSPSELIAPILELQPTSAPEVKEILNSALAARLPNLKSLEATLDRTALWSAGPRQRRSVLVQPWVFGYRVDSRMLNPEKYLRVDRELRRNFERQAH